MEERQLDFSLPLLSTRRFSSPSNSSQLIKHNRQPSLRSNKSIHEHEEVEKSATVPFHWEQIPGKPKQEVQTPEEPSVTLKVPPGRESGPFNDHILMHLNCEDESNSESDDDRYSVDEETGNCTANSLLAAAKDVCLETTEYVVKKPRVADEDSSECIDNVGSEEEQKNLVHVKKTGKSWGIFARFLAKNHFSLLHKLPGMRRKLQSPRNAHGGPSDKDLPQIENELIRDESPINSPVLDGSSKKVGNKIASNRKLFKSLEDVPRNQVHVQGLCPMDDAVKKTFYVDFLSKSNIQNFDQESDGNNLESYYQRQFDPSVLTPPLPKSPLESWLWRTIVKTSNLELIPDASDEFYKP